MQNTILYFNLAVFLYKPGKLGYASIVTIIIIVELHLIWQLGSKVQRQNLVCSQSYP